MLGAACQTTRPYRCPRTPGQHASPAYRTRLGNHFQLSKHASSSSSGIVRDADVDRRSHLVPARSQESATRTLSDLELGSLLLVPLRHGDHPTGRVRCAPSRHTSCAHQGEHTAALTVSKRRLWSRFHDGHWCCGLGRTRSSGRCGLRQQGVLTRERGVGLTTLPYPSANGHRRSGAPR